MFTKQIILSSEAMRADELRKKYYGNKIYIRGLIEISNFCKNNCYYCGIRCENKNIERYRLSEEEILDCAIKGYEKGFRTFVLQGGEDPFFTDEILCNIIRNIKERYNDVAVTLSLGERNFESFRKLKEAGADRYLLRHETASREHYEEIHPKEMSFENRMNSLYELKRLGYQTGCGFIVGVPYQTMDEIKKDLEFIYEFQPEMCGIGPFIPQKDTPFGDFKEGNADFTCLLIAIIRQLVPNALIPSTTALNSIVHDGRIRGIRSGANVIMPNLTPAGAREKYKIYDNKVSDDLDTVRCELEKHGYEIVIDRGDAERK